MSKLDDVLKKSGLITYNDGKTYSFMYIEDTEVGNVKQQLKDLMLELVGEDNPLDMSFNRTDDQMTRDTCYTQGVNESKNELRNKIGDL